MPFGLEVHLYKGILSGLDNMKVSAGLLQDKSGLASGDASSAAEVQMAVLQVTPGRSDCL